MSRRRAALNFVGGFSDRFMTRIPSFMLEPSELSRDEYLARLRFYADFPKDQPFFVQPTTAASAESIQTKPLPGGERVLFRYPSRYSARNPAMQPELARHTANQNGYLHLWRHDASASRPLVLCIHGFAMAGPTRGERMFKIERMFEAGLDVALHHLPHHWRRSDQPPNNQLLRPQDVPLTIEEWGRNLHDLHSAVLFLRSLGYGRIGLIGASLGGLTAALYATVEAPVDFIFLVVPAIDLTNFLMPRAGRMRFTPDTEIKEATAAAIRCIVPTTYPPRFDPKRMSVVAHEGDLICPVRHIRRLVQAWSIPNYVEVVGGHWVYLDRRVRGRTWYGWLQRQGYIGSPDNTSDA